MVSEMSQEHAMKSAGYYDLRQALTEPGCALRRLLARLADNHIDEVLWELVNDPDTRRNLNRSGRGRRPIQHLKEMKTWRYRQAPKKSQCCWPA